MQMLCARVVELLRKNPILWVPYVAAGLLASCLWELRGLVQSGIMHWFTTGHFVMDGKIALTRDNLRRRHVKDQRMVGSGRITADGEV